MFVAITTMLITIFIVNLVAYKLLQIDEIPYQRTIGIMSIIIIYIIMTILTYYPPQNDLFFDAKDEKYGINNYLTKK